MVPPLTLLMGRSCLFHTAEYHPSHSEWIRLLSVNGFVVQASTSCTPWASQWPVEDLWAAHLGSRPGRSG